MANLIEFIKLCVSNPLYPLSWGIGNIVVGHESISFFVKGSRYVGEVMIKDMDGSLKVVVGQYGEIFTDVEDAFSWLDKHIE